MGYKYIPTAQDLRMLNQKIKNVSVRIDILNKRFVTIDSIEGTVISDNYSINVDSDIRKTISLSLLVTKDYDILDIYKKIWIDRLFEIYFGVEDLISQEVVWYKFGVFTFDTLNYTIDESSYTLQINCIDLVALLNGTLSGQISGTGLIIPTETNGVPNTVREAMISTITELGGFERYDIEDMELEIPYDLEFGVGATIWEVITTLRDLKSGWETFFDVDGTFICQPIPTTEEEPIYIDNNVFNELVINESVAEDTTSIRNITKVFGKTLDTDYYIDNVSYSNNTVSYVYKVMPDDLNNFPIENSLGLRTSFVVPLKGKASLNNTYMFIKNRSDVYQLRGTNVGQINDGQYYYIDWHYDYREGEWRRTNWFEIPEHHYVTNNVTAAILVNSESGDYEMLYKANCYSNFNYLESSGGTTYKNTIILRNLPTGNNEMSNVYLSINNGTPVKISTKSTSISNESGHSVPTFLFETNGTYKIHRYVTGGKIGVNPTVRDEIVEISPTKVISEKSELDSQITYSASIAGLTIKNNTKIGVKMPTTSTSQPLLSLNGVAYKLVDVNGNYIGDGDLVRNKSYIFSFSNTSNSLVLQGQWQIMGMAKEVSYEPTIAEKELDKINESCDNISYLVNPDSPYTIEKVGELRQILSGDDYEKIYADELAVERAEYENWKATRLNDIVTINNIMIPWFSGNEKVEYTRKKVGETSPYIIKQVSGSVTTWTQTIIMSKFYPLYPFIIS